MSSIDKAELIIVPTPGTGHLVSTVEVAKALVGRDDRLSITILVTKLPHDARAQEYIDSLFRSLKTCRIKCVQLPEYNDPVNTKVSGFLVKFIEKTIPNLREAVRKLIGPNSTQVVGFLLDMFCTSVVDIANEFGIPSYIYFTSGAAFLGLMFSLQELGDGEGKDITEFKDDPDTELEFPWLVNPYPAKLLPPLFLKKGSLPIFMVQARRFKETKGVVVNTFTELESHAVKTLMDDDKYPPIYTVGPMLDLKNDNKWRTRDECEIMKWLDDQPDSSVVFLCFGSRGTLSEEQVREVAFALEQSGHRFLWSLRKSAPKDAQTTLPPEYSDLQDVVPEGFLQSTAGRGKVIGWAPQVEILAHRAIGGFVSHCGWNSILESLWFGVPIATWPLYGEQQFNAFLLVVELGLGVEVKMDYGRYFEMQCGEMVKADQIGRGIRRVMEESGNREKVKEMSVKSRTALQEGGSSYLNLGRFIEDVFHNIP